MTKNFHFAGRVKILLPYNFPSVSKFFNHKFSFIKCKMKTLLSKDHHYFSLSFNSAILKRRESQYIVRGHGVSAITDRARLYHLWFSPFKLVVQRILTREFKKC